MIEHHDFETHQKLTCENQINGKSSRTRRFFSGVGTFLGEMADAASEHAAQETNRRLDVLAAEEAPLVIDAASTGDLIRQARIARSVTIEELAAKTGIDEYILASFERTWSRDPSLDQLILIKKALNISVESIRKVA